MYGLTASPVFNIFPEKALSFPFHFNIDGTQIPWHSIIEPLAFFIGFRYYVSLRKQSKDVISSSNRMWVLIGAIFGAIIGSRLVGGLENLPALLNAPNKLLYFYQNKTVLGGFLGGLFGVEAIKKMIGEKSSSGDLFTYPIILALIVGRVGCFSMGIYEETYGTETDFLAGMNLGDGKLRHPVALYEMAFLVLLWLGLTQTEKKYQLANGFRFKIFMMAYCLFRFVLDFIKPHYTFSFGLSTIQITSIIGMIYYAIIYIQHKELFSIKRSNFKP
jgi:phosphatidylglycerol---prolipoprotein diacylglyceryl transferase